MQAIFLDRDNTLISDPGYIHKVEQVAVLPGVFEACHIFQRLGFTLFVVSNQSGVGRGYYGLNEIKNVEAHLKSLFQAQGITLHDFRYCLHHPDQKCTCRKPLPGMLEDLIKTYNISPLASYVVGDKETDSQCGETIGVQGILLSTIPHRTYPTFRSLLDFARDLESKVSR